MEDGEEEDDDNNYHHMFPEYSDTAIEDNGEEGGEEQASVSRLMNLVGSFLMQSETVKQKMRS